MQYADRYSNLHKLAYRANQTYGTWVRTDLGKKKRGEFSAGANGVQTFQDEGSEGRGMLLLEVML